MQSNYSQAKTAMDYIMVVDESLTALSELITTDCSVDIHLSEIARDGLANILAMLADKLQDGLEKMEIRERESQSGKGAKDAAQ